ncbi:MAG TPA: ATP-dependent 6-phosphofructokinase [Planctomycetota bacterium]|nr:ATP-dependent 6-phosphofructokinase [Planctomycetota bacterium]
MPRRIGILTGGGDAPGLNAVIRAVAKTLLLSQVEVLGIEDGFEGLLHDRVRRLSFDDVSGILARGGTILGTSNRGDPLRELDRAIGTYRKWELDGMVAIGGDGTLRIAHEFSKKGARIVGVPKTIDNDVAATHVTFGFDSAVSVAASAIESLHSTADAHRRIMVVEVMGRTAGWIALTAGVAGGADVILIPELKNDLDEVAEYIRERHRTRRFTLAVVAEGAGSGPRIGAELQKKTGYEARVSVLGHLQRAGQPTPNDRVLSTRFGCGAADLVLRGKWGRMVAVQRGQFTDVPLREVAGKVRRVPRDHELIRAARSVGTFLGK